MRRASGGPPVTEGGRSPRYRLTNPLPARSQGSRAFGCWTTTVSFFFFGPARFGPPRRGFDRAARNAWAPTRAPMLEKTRRTGIVGATSLVNAGGGRFAITGISLSCAFPDVSVARSYIWFCPAFSGMVPDHDVVP